MRANNYLDRTDIPKACPRFEQIAHESVVNDFDYERYSGIWYTFAHNEPTQAKGACHCDRFDWQVNQDGGSFTESLDTICTLFSSSPSSMTLWLEGKTNATGSKASMLEGAPSAGADLIPNHVIWVDENYQACIRFSCQEHYLGVPVFSSLQIWTRTPTAADSERGKALMEQAHELVEFSDEYIEFVPHHDCDLSSPLKDAE